MKAVLGSTLVALAAIGCSSSSGPHQLEIQVAPLELPGIGGACYDLAVTTASDTVWSLGDEDVTHLGHPQTAPERFSLEPATLDPDATTVCSGTFGNGPGGAISYVGPCDASEDADTDPVRDGVQNTVTLWVDGLYTAGGAAEIGEWQDPCPGGCALQVDCEENADTSVVFDLTIMRDAQQGFFDVAVNFGDVFCSAKLDTCYENETATLDDDEHIELLFGGDSTRDWTAVFGFACTAGPGEDTVLHYGDVAVSCVTGPEDPDTGITPTVEFAINPRLGEGNQSVVASNDPDHTLHYGIYRGDEELECDDEGTSCSKRYWNLAFDLADLAGLGDCRVQLTATASDGTVFDNGAFVNTEGLTYPFIEVDGALTVGGAPECKHTPVDETEEIKTVYPEITPWTPKVCNEFDGTEVRNVCLCPCWPNGGDPLAGLYPRELAAQILALGDGHYVFNHGDVGNANVEGSAARSVAITGDGGFAMSIGAGFEEIRNACAGSISTTSGTRGYAQGGGADAEYDACRADVDFVFSLTPTGCGDGVLDPTHGEECEDDNLLGSDGCQYCRDEYFLHYTYVDAGISGSCGLRPDGSIRCWDLAPSGVYQGPLVTRVPAGDGFVAVAVGGGAACAIDGVGAITCWGNDEDPVVAGVPSGTFTSIAAGEGWACATHEDGSLACWGTFAGVDAASLTPAGIGYTSLSGLTNHACALRSNGTAACWGDSFYFEQSIVPASLVDTEFSEVSAGIYNSCGLDAAGTIVCWGTNDFGAEPGSVPWDAGIPTPNSGYSQVGAGLGGGCMLRGTELVCWNAVDTLPVGEFTQLSVGLVHGCVLATDGFVHCWGDNGGGPQPTSFEPDL